LSAPLVKKKKKIHASVFFPQIKIAMDERGAALVRAQLPAALRPTYDAYKLRPDFRQWLRDPVVLVQFFALVQALKTIQDAAATP